MQRLSTRGLPARQRLAFVHDFIARHWAGMHFELPGGQAGDVDISVFELADGVALASAHYPPMVARRSRELLADGRDNYTLGIVSEEHEVSVEGGPGLTVRAGDLVLLNEGTWFEMRHASASAVEVISLPGRGIGRHLARLAAAPGHHIPRGTQGAALLAGYANLLRQAPPQGAGERAAAARHLQELVGVVLEEHAGRARQRHAVPPPGGLRAARLALARRQVHEQAHDATLDVHAVARRQGVGARYIQELFEHEGTTFTAFLRDTRLEMAWQALSSGRGGSIAAIAFECGFSDLSNFNRSFRRRYGLRPSDVRAQALTRRRGQ